MTYRARHLRTPPLGLTIRSAHREPTAAQREPTAAQRERSRTSTLVLLACGLAFALAFARLALHVASPAFQARMFDLGIYRDGGLIVRHAYHFRSGRPTPLYDWVSPGGGNPFTYPPFAAGIFAVMSYLPLATLRWGMTVASTGALVIAIWLTLAAAGMRAGRARAGAALAVSAVALWTLPVESNLGLGQVNLLLMTAIIWDLRPAAATSRPGETAGQEQGRRAGSRWWTGAVTGIAAGIKLTPLIFIGYLIVTRRFRQAATASAAFAATVAVGYLAMPGASAAYWSTGLFARASGTRKGNVEFFFASAWNQSLRGVLSRLLLHAPLAIGPWLIAALLTAVVGLSCAAWLHHDGHPMLGLLTCALTGLLISPVSWLHHWVWVAPWLAALTAMAWRSRGAARWSWMTVTALVALAFADWPVLPLRLGGAHGLTVVTAVPMKHPFSWHGIQLVAGNVFVVVGLAGLLALTGWGVVRAARQLRAARADNGAASLAALLGSESAPGVMMSRT